MTEYFNHYEWNKQIQKVSNIDKAIINTKKYLGNNTFLYPSEKCKYKYKIFDPNKNKLRIEQEKNLLFYTFLQSFYVTTSEQEFNYENCIDII